MQGFLEPDNQALVTLDFGQGPLDFLIDTGFNGTLIVGEEILDTRDLDRRKPLHNPLSAKAGHADFLGNALRGDSTVDRERPQPHHSDMDISCRIQNGVVVLDSPVTLAEGTAVTVT